MRLCLGNPPDSVAMFWRPKLAAPQWPFSCSHQLTCAAMRPAGQHSLLQYGAIGAIWLLVWNIANWVSSNYLPTDLVWWTLFLHHWKQLFQVFWCGGDAIWIFLSFILLIWATALFLDLAESFVGWYQLVPAVCQCQCKSTSWVVSVHWSMCSLNDSCQWWLNLCYFFLLCFRVHEEAAWADEPTGFIATWCNHGASDGPLQLTSFRYLDTGFGRVLWSTPGKTNLSSSTIQRGKSWDIWGFDTHKTKTGALCISSQKISNHGTWSIVFFFPLLRRTFWSRAGGVPGTSWN